MGTSKKRSGTQKADTTAIPVRGRPGFSTPPPSAMIYTLGDSWFTYPTIFDQGAPINLIRALDSQTQPHGARYLLNENGEPGATTDLLTTGDYFDGLARALAHNYDFLLLSMGGNDFVGTNNVNGVVERSFGHFLLDYNRQSKPEDCLDQHAVSDRLDKTLANYQKVFRTCERLSANDDLQIVAHVYDYPMPTDKGAMVLDRWHVLGPWMYPDLVAKGIPKSLWNGIIEVLLTQFATRLETLADDLNAHTSTGVRFHVAQTQGVIPAADPSYWINEIHPKNIGYKLLVKKFAEIVNPIVSALPPAQWRAWPT